MKSFKKEDLEAAYEEIKNSSNTVLKYFADLIQKENELSENKKFVKAEKSYIKTLTYNDVYFRDLEKTDFGYYPGMYGMFKKGSNKLLARHTDRGALGSMLKKS